ncbi:MAG: hypothetical protein PHU03_04390, partial [Syntrophales bacterium]|nr:hypothetical protein [Syntrophales bacterium]
MSESLEEVLQSIKNGKEPSCCLLYGEESYLIADALQRILRTLLPEGADDLNCFRMDGERTDVESICEAVLTRPLISGKKAVVVRNTTLFASKTSTPSLPDDFLTLLNNDPPAAARSFMNLLGGMGWSLEDLRHGDGGNIPAEVWDRVF